jgi:hypothetical protein
MSPLLSLGYPIDRITDPIWCGTAFLFLLLSGEFVLSKPGGLKLRVLGCFFISPMSGADGLAGWLRSASTNYRHGHVLFFFARNIDNQKEKSFFFLSFCRERLLSKLPVFQHCVFTLF